MGLINKSYLVTLNQRVQGSKSLCAHPISLITAAMKRTAGPPGLSLTRERPGGEKNPQK